MSRFFERKGGLPTTHKKKKNWLSNQFFFFSKIDAGNGLSSQEVALQVLSSLWVFTTVFGMGTGGLLMLGHQRILWIRSKLHKIQALRFHQLTLSWTIALRCTVVHSILLSQKFRSLRSALHRVRLTDVRRHSTQSSIRKSPRPISNTRLKMLPLLHLCPINVIIYNGTY